MTNIQQYQITQSYKNPLRASMLQITEQGGEQCDDT